MGVRKVKPNACHLSLSSISLIRQGLGAADRVGEDIELEFKDLVSGLSPAAEQAV